MVAYYIKGFVNQDPERKVLKFSMLSKSYFFDAIFFLDFLTSAIEPKTSRDDNISAEFLPISPTTPFMWPCHC